MSTFLWILGSIIAAGLGVIVISMVISICRIIWSETTKIVSNQKVDEKNK